MRKLNAAMSRRPAALVAVVVVVALIALAAGFLVGGNILSPDRFTPTPSPSPSPEPSPSPTAPAGFVTFKEPETGFSLAVPENWEGLESDDPEVRFAATSRDQRDALLVSVRQEPGPVGDVTAASRRITSFIANSGNRVTILTGPQVIDVSGQPGLFYFYTFQADKRRRGAHSRYFVFQRSKVISVVFQTIPADSFTRAAPLFDRITETFHLPNE